MRPRFQVADVLDKAWAGVETAGFTTWQIRTLRAVKDCRTQALGGHIDACNECGHLQISYNSCRNRHCPTCQGHKREQWIEARKNELLPVPYFHVVFTLPACLNAMAIAQPKVVYDSLFKASWQTIQAFGGKQSQSGMIAVLHTWGQNLSLHPHLHCIVPAATVDCHLKWSKSKSNGRFLYPVKALSTVFRAKYVALLRDQTGRSSLPAGLFDKPWVVYAKRPFGGPDAVIEYLGRYTHKIAISNHRLIQVGEHHVSFSYKDYTQDGKKKVMELPHLEFIRRFALHILPKRFVRIRHFGYLSSTWKRGKLKSLQQVMCKDTNTRVPKNIPQVITRKCPCCKSGQMIILLTFDSRGPPLSYLKAVSQQNHCLVSL